MNYSHKTVVNGKALITGASLYTACAAAIKDGQGDVILGGRLVAFFCEWRNCIAPGFGANDCEREALEDMFGKAPTL